MSSAGTLQAARSAAGIPQRVAARRAGTSQSAIAMIESSTREPGYDLLDRALRACRHRLVALPTVRPDVVSTAERMRRLIAEGRRDAVLRTFLDYADSLALESPATRVALAVARPMPTGEAAWDAALAAVTEYRLARAGLPVPEWVNDADRVLAQPTAPSLDVAPGSSEGRQAIEFSRRNVLLDERVLASV